MPGGFFVAAVSRKVMGMSELWHSRFKRGIYEADDFVSCLPTAKAVGYASTAPTGLNRRQSTKGIGAAEAAVQLRCRLGVIAAVAAGYEVIWLWVMGVRPLCGRRMVGWRCPKLRSAYLGFSGVSPLRGFLRLCCWAVAAAYW